MQLKTKISCSRLVLIPFRVKIGMSHFVADDVVLALLLLLPCLYGFSEERRWANPSVDFLIFHDCCLRFFDYNALIDLALKQETHQYHHLDHL